MDKIFTDIPQLITTSRLLLQMPCAGFGAELHSAISDGYEDYVKWLNWSVDMPTIADIEKECRIHHAEFILRDGIRYLIIERHSKQIVGRCAFPSSQANWLVGQFGISYFIRKSKRGQGYATEAAHALAILGFKVLAARKIEICCDEENIASAKVPLKLGFELEYIQRGGVPRFDNKLARLQTYAAFSIDDLPVMDVKW